MSQRRQGEVQELAEGRTTGAPNTNLRSTPHHPLLCPGGFTWTDHVNGLPTLCLLVESGPGERHQGKGEWGERGARVPSRCPLCPLLGNDHIPALPFSEGRSSWGWPSPGSSKRSLPPPAPGNLYSSFSYTLLTPLLAGTTCSLQHLHSRQTAQLRLVPRHSDPRAPS